MGKSRIDISFSYDLRALVEELEGLWALSSPSYGVPTLHDFVRGLIFSEKMIQIIDTHISGYNADWGQIVDVRTGNYLSRECDIIIYKKNPIRVWGKRAIKFVVVENTAARLVIQCSKDITSLPKGHENYCKNVKQFVPEIWYFAECYWGSKNQCNVIRKKLKEAGYDRFFHLYRKYEREGEMRKELNYGEWKRFIKLIRSLK